MGRMHSKGKGIAASALPYKTSAPSWCKATGAEVSKAHISIAAQAPRESVILLCRLMRFSYARGECWLGHTFCAYAFDFASYCHQLALFHVTSRNVAPFRAVRILVELQACIGAIPMFKSGSCLASS
jgi:hypothetical protein